MNFDDLDATKLDVVIWPDERLHQIAEEVTEFDDDLKQLIVDMYYTMRLQNGVGIAAPQVGVNKRLIVLRFDEQIIIMINPEIVSEEGEQTFEEGCLSVPGYFANMKRANEIQVRFVNEDNEELNIVAMGMQAVAIQHEIDHINGKVFVDYLSMFKQSRAKAKIKKTLKR